MELTQRDAVNGGKDERTDEAAVLAWSVRLIKTRPKAAWRIAACVLMVAVAGSIVFKSVTLGLIPAAAIVLSLSEFLFPIHYQFSSKCVTMRNGLVWLEMPWADVRHAYVTGEGIKLSPLRQRNSRVEPMRGIFVRFGDQKRDMIIDEIQRLRPHFDAGPNETAKGMDGAEIVNGGPN